jgi:hypothetical protein
VLSEREHIVAEKLDFHNFISIDKFMEGKNKPFKRIITGYLIDCLIRTYKETFDKKECLVSISKPLYDEVNSMLDYHSKNYHRIGDEDVYKAMLVIAEENNLFDETIFTEYTQLKELLDTFPFIESTMELFPYSYKGKPKEKHVDLLVDLFKYYRIRIDYTNYKLRLNEEIVEPLTEDTLEQLTQNN